LKSWYLDEDAFDEMREKDVRVRNGIHYVTDDPKRELLETLVDRCRFAVYSCGFEHLLPYIINNRRNILPLQSGKIRKSPRQNKSQKYVQACECNLRNRLHLHAFRNL